MPRFSLEQMKLAKQAMVKAYLPEGAGTPEGRAMSVSLEPRMNVVGVGLGPKNPQDKEPGPMSIRFYVARKVPPGALPEGTRLPDSIDGIPTDVIETGVFRLHAGEANRRRRRPIRPGSSIGFQFPPPNQNMVMAGTFGVVVKRDGKKFILSNNHVLAENGAIQPGAPIFQPGLLDGGSTVKDAVGKLTTFIPVTREENSVDCAIAEVDNGVPVDPALLPQVGRLKSAVPIAARNGMQVEKTGRTTGYRRGRIIDISLDVRVGFEDQQGEFDALFVDQILIVGTAGMFSDSGDSGSLIVDRATKRATGLLFAGAREHTVANPIQLVMQKLGVQLVV